MHVSRHLIIPVGMRPGQENCRKLSNQQRNSMQRKQDVFYLLRHLFAAEDARITLRSIIYSSELCWYFFACKQVFLSCVLIALTHGPWPFVAGAPLHGPRAVKASGSARGGLRDEKLSGVRRVTGRRPGSPRMVEGCGGFRFQTASDFSASGFVVPEPTSSEFIPVPEWTGHE